MIDFEHGALRRTLGERELAGILAHGVLPPATSQALTLLVHADALVTAEWQVVLTGFAARMRDSQHAHAIIRLRDAIADAPVELTPVMDALQARITALTRVIHPFVEPAATIGAYAVLLRVGLGEEDLAHLYAPFERFIPLESLG